MKILVIGGGAREHAIVWKIKQSEKVKKIFVAPGNAGTSEIAENILIQDNDIIGLVNFAKINNIDLTIVGPESPLCLGIVDEFEKQNLRIFGPNKKAAQLEGSKVFCKKFLKKHNIPTAKYKSFTKIEEAKLGLIQFTYPLVIKADGLAAGKGVIICDNSSQANSCLNEMMLNNKFGSAGKSIVIEEFLEGTEASLLCFVDGKTIVPLESAKDYKKTFDNDKGLNTGGMGAYSPNHLYNEELNLKIKERILIPTMNGFKKDKINFKGLLFIGLMIKGDNIKVLEFNVRFGDPETEAILPRMKSDIIDIFEKCIDGKLFANCIEWSKKECVCVVIASDGYPENYEKNKIISGLNEMPKDVIIFHAGTKKKNNKVLTNGGRVLAITCLNTSVENARKKIYNSIDKIKFENSFYRSDIGIY